MESREIINPEKEKEVTLIKKGFFYYLFQLIALPFKLIYKFLKFSYFEIMKNHKSIQEIIVRRNKTKNLNRLLTMKRDDEEII